VVDELDERAERDELVVRVVTILTLGVLLLAAIVGITITAVMTDRNVWRAEVLTFGGVVLLGALGGVSWLTLRRRRRWRVNVERSNGNGP
jgi:membrane protein YdbS with pleckstrin-like domain